ncbi:MAG: response regulator transcription factor [Bacteroidetes bacterium]|nr:response regulator transcription factor [Bacteroidota bacterium]
MLRVAIAEDHSPTRHRLIEAIHATEGMTVVASAPDGLAFLRALENLPASDRPQVAIVDVEMPGPTGIEVTGELRARYPHLGVLIFTVFEDGDRLFAAIEAGASGYLLKDQPMAEVIEAVKELHAGGSPLSPPMARRLLDRIRRPPTSEAMLDLTEREVETLRGIVDGLSNVEIAERLFVSPSTVKTHVKHIYEKLHVSSRAEATRRALREGLVRTLAWLMPAGAWLLRG